MNAHLHGGKWSEEEELYAAALIEAFKAGVLPPEDIDEGTSLRKYLAKKLMCSPKRVSKKYEGTNYNGKQVYFKNRGTSGTVLTPTEELALRAKIQILEHKFLKTLSENKTPGGLATRPASSEFEVYTQIQMQALNEGHEQLTSRLLSAAQSPHHPSMLASALPTGMPQTASLAQLQEQPSRASITGRLLSTLSGPSANMLGSSSGSLNTQRISQEELSLMGARIAAGNHLRLPSSGLSASGLSSGLTSGASLPNNPQLLSQLGATQSLMDAASLEAARLQQIGQSARMQQLGQSLLSSQGIPHRSLGANPLVGGTTASLEALRSSRVRAASLIDPQHSLLNASLMESYLKENALLSPSSTRRAASLATPAAELLRNTAQAQLLQGRPNLALPFPGAARQLLATTYAGANEETKRQRHSEDTKLVAAEAPPSKRWKPS